MATNFYDKASLVLIPSGYKAGKLYSVKPTDGTGDFTFSRATGYSSRTGPTGKIQEVADNTPRLQYPKCPAVLLEPSRENLFLNSDVGATQTITVVSGSDYAIYFLDGDGQIDLTGATTATVTKSDLDLSGAYLFTAGSTSLTCTVTGTANMVQLELGTYPTTYIKTEGSTVTRALENLLLTGIDTSGILTGATGTLFFKQVSLNNDAETKRISLSDGTSANRLVLAFNSDSTISSFMQIAGVTVASNPVVGFTYDAGQTINACVAWGGSDFKVSLNGELFAGSLTGTPIAFPNFNTLDPIGSRYYGEIDEMLIFPTALTDDELFELTNPEWTSYSQMAQALNYTLI